MNGLSFSQMRRIQFIAANYSRLQGLRGLPIGLLLFGMSFWANVQHGPAPRPVLIPILLGMAAVGLYWLVDRYYKQAFGQVIPVTRGHLGWLVNIATTVLALVAFLIENTAHLSFSPTGIVLAAAFLIDYLMLVLMTQQWYLPFWPVFPLLMSIVSILPVLGLADWWTVMGIKVQILGVMMASGLIMVAAAMSSHVYFTRMLTREVSHGGSV